MRLLALCVSLWWATWASLAVAAPPEATGASLDSGAGGAEPNRADFGRAKFGGAGLSRVRSAFIIPRTLSASAHGGLFIQSNLTAPGGVDEHHLALVGATLAPLPWLELSATSRNVTHDQPASALGQGYLVSDLLLRAKVGQALGPPGLTAAVEGVLRVPPPVGRADPLWLGMSPGLGGLLTYDLNPSGVPLRLHLNTGLFIDNSVDFDDETQSLTRRFALAINTWNQWQSGVAVEGRVRLGEVYLVPFLEYTLDVPLGAAEGIGGSPMRVTPGLRVLPWKGVVVDAAVELAANRGSVPGMLPVPDYMALLSVGYQGSLETERRWVERVVERRVEAPALPGNGRVLGRAVEEQGRQPIADAVISLPEHSRLLADASGSFVARDIAPGPIWVRAEREGYDPAQVEGKLEPGGELSVELVMKRLPPAPPPKAIIRGTIIGEKDRALTASVGAPGSGVEARLFPNGEYELQVPAGEAGLEVSAPGYLPQGRRVSVRPGETVIADFVLQAKPKLSLVVLRKDKIEIKKQVHFATNRDVILPDSTPLLDQVAAVILSNPQLRLIRIEGHTDDRGEDAYNMDLSNRRAKSVMRSLLERGIEPKRLRAVGYGETKPIQSNKTNAGRAKNRRVEFMIEEQE